MSWNNKPTNFGLEVVQIATTIKKQIIGETLQQVVVRSPVMDGEFRASHKVTVDSPQASYDKSFDLAGGATLKEGIKVTSTVELGSVVYVQTLSPYGLALENGHSQQAPEGIYALTAEYIKSKYK